jgi:hypothetical protein
MWPPCIKAASPLEEGYFALKVKFAVAGFPAATVIFCVWVP